MARSLDIVGGPDRFDLFLSIGRMEENNEYGKCCFEIKALNPSMPNNLCFVFLNRLGRTKPSGNDWDFEGITAFGEKEVLVRGTYSTKTHQGTVSVDIDD